MRELTPSAYDRHEEHVAHGVALIDFLLSLPSNGPKESYPSTADLQASGRFGLRPVNRLVDARHGKYRNIRYDVEMISCGGGTNRWKIHWPNRIGFPKTKDQMVLPVDEPEQQHPFQRNMSKARRSAGAWKPQPIVPTKSWSEIVAERDRKLSESQPEFHLTP